MSSFEKQIQEWVLIDNQIKLHYDKIVELRERKSILNSKIVEHIEDNKLEKATIQITDGKLKLVKNKIASPPSFRYIEKTLGDIIKNQDQVKRIVNYLKENREFKTVSEIKRIYTI
jgi:uncharacterized protein YlzI (FlbEa/FlbD family)